MKALLPIPALLLAMHASAACFTPRPANDMPAIPDGSAATAEAMPEAQHEVAAYADSIQKYVECRLEELLELEHNFLVNGAQTAAENYSSELRAFREHQAAIAQN